MNSGEPFNKIRQVGLVQSYLSTLLQMFIMSCVYKCWGCLSCPKCYNKSLPCPGASVGHIQGDRKVTMVITSSFQYTHCSPHHHVHTVSVEGAQRIWGPCWTPRCHRWGPWSLWWDGTQMHPGPCKLPQLHIGARWWRRTRMWSRHAHHERLNASEWLRAFRSCTNTNTTCDTCGTCGTRVHDHSFTTTAWFLASIHNAEMMFPPVYRSLPSHSLLPPPPLMSMYSQHNALWWYATQALIFPFSSGSTQKLSSQSPADTSNFLECDATNMADEVTILGANGAPM